MKKNKLKKKATYNFQEDRFTKYLYNFHRNDCIKNYFTKITVIQIPYSTKSLSYSLLTPNPSPGFLDFSWKKIIFLVSMLFPTYQTEPLPSLMW